MNDFLATLQGLHSSGHFGASLRHWAQQRPDAIAFRFLDDEEREVARLSFAELDARANSVAAALIDSHAAGAAVLLLYPPGLEFIVAFFACLYAGSIAVPAYPPSKRLSSQTRLHAIIEDCGARLILTDQNTIAQFGDTLAKTTLDVLPSDTLSAITPARPLRHNADHLAFLQYTSGSTGRPKGVRVSHDNLLANQRAIRSGFAHGPDTVFVGWCPLYHDMGLIGNVLQPVYLGIPSILMSPVSFMQQPARWLRTISRYRATTSGGPNFAYDLCAARIGEQDKALLDLSSWRIAFNGAEPVRAETLSRFAETFASCGFRAESMFPCYGMAETTLFVSGATPGAGAVTASFDTQALRQGHLLPAHNAASQILVSSGQIRDDQQVRIVDPHDGRLCAPGVIGEIWVRGSSVADGYQGAPEQTAQQFAATIEGDDTHYLRTGDLGCLEGEQLYVTGRMKEVIIVRGQNHYPGDIEQTIEQSHPGLRRGCGAAFGINDDGHERLIVVQELERHSRHTADIESIMRTASASVAAQHGIPLRELLLVAPGIVPKTSSGKIQRGEVKRRYLSGEIEALARQVAENAPIAPLSHVPTTEPAVAAILNVVATLGKVSVAQFYDTSLSGLGFDSLTLAQLQHGLQETLGLRVDFDELFDERPIIELARAWASESTQRATVTPPLATVTTHDAPIRLTPYQEALWTAQRLDAKSASFNLLLPFQASWTIDYDALVWAIDELVERYPALSSTFVQEGEYIYQHAVKPKRPLLTRHAGEHEDEDALRMRILSTARQPIDLQNGPVFRVETFARTGQSTVLAIIVHHLVADLHSLQILLGTLLDLYRCRAQGLSPALPTSLQYAGQYTQQYDYAGTVDKLLSAPAAAVQARFWEARLVAPIDPILLPAPAQARQASTSMTSGMSIDVPIDDALCSQLDALRGKYGATRAMTILAAFFALLHRYSSQQDLSVLTPASVRPGAPWESWLGYAVNPLPIRLAISPEHTFASLLQAVKNELSASLAHRFTPFIDMARQHGRQRSGAKLPLGNVMFVYQHPTHLPQAAGLLAGPSGQALSVAELDIETFPVPAHAAQADLTLMAVQTQAGLVLRFEYDDEVVDAQTVTRMANHFLRLLNTLTTAPNQTLGEAPLLDTEQWHKQLVEWNSRRLPDNLFTSTSHMLDVASVNHADAIAVRDGQSHLHYGELRRMADSIAASLYQRGVRRGHIVGIGLPRRPPLLAALWAIWKCGAAYLPLDRALPDSRLLEIVGDARATLVIGDAALNARLADIAAPLVEIDALQPLAGLRAPDIDIQPDDLAYVLYTSGSTGKPKGVEIEHRNVMALLDWVGLQYRPDELAAVYAGTNIAFDISVFELFGPLAHGGSVVIGESPITPPPCPVTLLNTVPSAAETLLANGVLPDTVHTINLAGEPLRQSLVSALYKLPHIERVYDLYGPTEDTVYSTCTLRDPEEEANIGRPLPGKRVYILDAQQQPVAIGVIGELYLAGDGQARGYRGRTDLTEAAFLAVPSLANLETRLYRSGDLGRFLPDGRIVLCGRRDQQVKIRGHRVEIGEIESALSTHPEIREIAVLAQQEGHAPLLVAHCATHIGATLTAHKLDVWLSASLPAHMRPTRYAFHDTLPHTPSGKIDRKALPIVERESADGVNDRALTGTERSVLQIWQEVLGYDDFGVDADLFELGGHSLHVARLLTRAEQLFGIEVPVQELLGKPTIAEMASCIDRLATEDETARAAANRQEVLL